MFARSVKPEAPTHATSDSRSSRAPANGVHPAAAPEPELDPERLPKHIAIIMDGNRRWAKQKGWLAMRGHTVGATTTQNIIQECVDLGIGALTLYTFSTENWKRPGAEVSALMRLITRNLRDQLPTMQRNNVQIRHLGRRDDLPDYLLRQLDECTKSTLRNTGLVLNLALNYGGRAEILDAFKVLLGQVQAGTLKPEDVTEELIGRALYTLEQPEPDLMIRTGGEMRISNFLPWQIAYAELWITPILWPEFMPRDLRAAISDFQCRDRRTGA